jgi:two-component system, OmpR family, sensor histidine kinase KdpD
MACINAGSLASHLVRTAQRLAERRHAKWLAVFIETARPARRSESDRDSIAQALHLAEQLGGEAVALPGRKVAEDLLTYARKRNVTELIIGQPFRSRWQKLRHGSLVHDIIEKSGDIDIHVVAGDQAEPAAHPSAPFWSGFKVNKYLGSALAVGCAALLATVIASFLSLPDLSMVFLAAVLFSAVAWGLLPSVFAAVLSVAIYDFFFVPPLHTLTVDDPQDLLALIIFLIVAVLISNLTGRVQDHADALQRQESRTAILYSLSRQLARSAALEDVLQVTANQVAEILGAQAVVLLPGLHGIEIKASQPQGETLSSQDWAAAMWAWQHNQPAGLGSDMLPGCERSYVPLTTAQRTVGVLGLRFPISGKLPSPDQRLLVQALADQAAVAIERANLAQSMAEARSLAETERLRSALLSSISHDLRTPLSSITGAVTSLLSFGADYKESERRDLLLTIQEEADRLNHFVGNLLDTTRLEAGALKLNREWVEIGDIIGAALGRLQRLLSDHHVIVQVEPGLPLLWLDFVLVEQVFTNLLDNAARYSATGTDIRVHARRETQQGRDTVVIGITDQGVGVPRADLERIFDKFYRVYRADHQVAGTGLGLSICRGLVEAHGGTVSAHLPAGGTGTILRVAFPVQKGPSVAREREEAHE